MTDPWRRALRWGVACALTAAAAVAQAAALLIVLDPGHSPDQGGSTSASNVKEVVYNDRFVAELAPALERSGWRVRITRTPDQSMGLAQRPAVANRAHAAVFLSIHHDSAQLAALDPVEVNGTTVYRTKQPIAGYSLYVSRENPDFAQSLKLAELLGQQLRALGRPPNLTHADPVIGESRPLLNRDLGIYQYDGLAVLRHAQVPAVLLEVGVIVDPADEAYVNNAANRRVMIARIVAALDAFRADGMRRK